MRRLSVLLGLLLAAAGCGSAAEPGAAGGGAEGLPVERAFDAVEAAEGGRERPLVAKAGIEFLADGRTLVATGCNTGSGRASLRDGKLVADDLAVTQMGCLDPRVSEQEAFVLSVVGAEPTMVLDGDTLVLRSAAAEIRFLDRKVANPDRPLEGTRWRVDGFFDAQLASSIAAPKGERSSSSLATSASRYTTSSSSSAWTWVNDLLLAARSRIGRAAARSVSDSARHTPRSTWVAHCGSPVSQRPSLP